MDLVQVSLNLHSSLRFRFRFRSIPLFPLFISRLFNAVQLLSSWKEEYLDLVQVSPQMHSCPFPFPIPCSLSVGLLFPFPSPCCWTMGFSCLRIVTMNT